MYLRNMNVRMLIKKKNHSTQQFSVKRKQAVSVQSSEGINPPSAELMIPVAVTSAFSDFSWSIYVNLNITACTHIRTMLNI